MKPYYDCDGIILYHAKAEDVLSQLADASVDFILTDPPYGHRNNDDDLASRREEALGVGGGEPKRPIANDGPEANELVKWFFKEANRLLKFGCCCCCCCCGGGPDPQFARWSLWMDEAIGFKQAVVWDKGGLGMGWHYRRNYEMVLVAEKPGAACHWYGGNSQANVVNIPGIKPPASGHPTPKPIELMEFFIRCHTQPGDLVIDPFVGGGSSAIAAKLHGCRFIGCDVELKWLELAANRLRQSVLNFEG